MNVTFALFTHYTHDDRIWFHQAKELCKTNCNVSIVSALKEEEHYNEDGFHDIARPHIFSFDHTEFHRKDAFGKMAGLIGETNPDIIICDSPLAVISATRFKKSRKSNATIIYDVTEWYPSKKNLFGLKGVRKLAKRITLSIVNYYVGFKCDGFIFGEYYKAQPFLHRHPKKPYIFLPYYPDLAYIKKSNNKPDECWNLCYCGNATAEKGFPVVFRIIEKLATQMPEIRFNFNIIGTSDKQLLNGDCNASSPSKSYISNLNINILGRLPFIGFCNEIGKNHVFFDLRQMDSENTKCLPIKLFYYMACGRPVIYSNLMAIKQGVPEYSEIGKFVCQDVENEAVTFLKTLITDYIEGGTMYQDMSDKAIALSNEKYNWDNIKQNFVAFIINFK